MQLIRVPHTVVERHFEAIAQIGNLGPGQGFLRAGYSHEETKAMEHFMELGRAMGFKTYYDEVGNAVIEKAGKGSQWVEMFSHVDTVNKGGNYDGLTGVAAAFEAMAALRNRNLKVGMRLRIFRLEEGDTFKIPLFGSSAAFGVQTADVLDNTFNGNSLRQAMESQGIKPARIALGNPTILPTVADTIAAAFEVHISQAKNVPHAGNRIGLVTSIRGSQRYFVEVTGEFDHSGGTEPPDRHDSFLACSYINVELDKLMLRWRSKGRDIVYTMNQVNCDRTLNNSDGRVYENGPTKVSGFSYFHLDIRSNNDPIKEAFAKKALEIIRDTCKRFWSKGNNSTTKQVPRRQTARHSALGNCIGTVHENGTALQYMREWSLSRRVALRITQS